MEFPVVGVACHLDSRAAGTPKGEAAIVQAATLRLVATLVTLAARELVPCTHRDPGARKSDQQKDPTGQPQQGHQTLGQGGIAIRIGIAEEYRHKNVEGVDERRHGDDPNADLLVCCSTVSGIGSGTSAEGQPQPLHHLGVPTQVQKKSHGTERAAIPCGGVATTVAEFRPPLAGGNRVRRNAYPPGLWWVQRRQSCVVADGIYGFEEVPLADSALRNRRPKDDPVHRGLKLVSGVEGRRGHDHDDAIGIGIAIVVGGGGGIYSGKVRRRIRDHKGSALPDTTSGNHGGELDSIDDRFEGSSFGQRRGGNHFDGICICICNCGCGCGGCGCRYSCSCSYSCGCSAFAFTFVGFRFDRHVGDVCLLEDQYDDIRL